jgi:hypothetical protein
MPDENIESYLYRPRQVVPDLGIWEIGALQFKVYGIIAEGQALSEGMINDAYDFTRGEVPRLVKAEGRDNGLGFVIIHPGDLGISILAHWWIQGSILCQHIQRTSWGSDTPMNMSNRPVIACVWELGLINAERILWRNTMMTAAPDSDAYLSARSPITKV